ncbi:hypothetical protein RhiXN_07248 [Rhizoctonia solani]|uniref:Uncharacterized protein n=1 Tax=Rhizoctonia solani TaxID=456999 RepID=A0A8H8T1F1_9AGAM|nr:uncharacterized protein RhiXN_07248 [Rhizoctonia solani]QRW25299.1 hypothetical protein RhiXN_07248 [Rhizoctonia solani]
MFVALKTRLTHQNAIRVHRTLRKNVVSPVQQSIEIDSTPNGAGEANVASTAADEKMDTNDSQLKKRPRIDMATEPRKKGRSVFGMVLGTLKKAKDEDKARASTETAKRRAEDSMIRQRQSTLPALANFLLTTDNIPSDFTFDPSVVAEPGDTDTNMADATTKDGAAPRGKQLSQFYLSLHDPAIPRLDLVHALMKSGSLKPNESWLLRKKRGKLNAKGLEEIQILKQNAQEAQEAARVAHKAEEGAEKPTENDGEPALNTSGENESKMEGVEGER